MPIKLTGGSHELLTPLQLDKDIIRKMVKAYRLKHNSDPNCLKFIHFSLKEVVQLFIDNGCFDPAKPIKDQLNGLDHIGVKIYLATHLADSDSPQNPTPGSPNRYIGMDTAIICNTQLNDADSTWEDQLSGVEGDENSVSLTGAGVGLDRGAICPPNCPPTKDADGNIHQDIGV